jgi:hypothetical protein
MSCDSCDIFTTYNPLSDRTSFVAVSMAGATATVYAIDVAETRQAITQAGAPPPGLTYVQAQGFRWPPANMVPPLFPAADILLQEFEALATVPLIVKADTPIWQGGGGILGCALKDQNGNTYFLTAGHVVRSFPMVSVGGQPAAVRFNASYLTIPCGLDWALLMAYSGVTASPQIFGEQKNLSGPMSSQDIAQLAGQTIFMRSIGSPRETSGVVAGADVCVLVNTIGNQGVATPVLRPHQILVQSTGGQPFGQHGDSGAVAYDQNGVAIGLYWQVNIDGTLHLLTPLVDIIGLAGAATNNTFTLWS